MKQDSMGTRTFQGVLSAMHGEEWRGAELEVQELHARLAASLFGWKPYTTSKGKRILLDCVWMDAKWGESHSIQTENNLLKQTWATDGKGMLRVINAMRKKSYQLKLIESTDGWYAAFVRGDEFIDSVAWQAAQAKTPMLAVAIAADTCIQKEIDDGSTD